MEKITTLIDQIGDLNNEANEHFVAYKDIKERLDVLKMQLSATLNEVGLKSAKTNRYNASIVFKSDILLEDEHTVMDWLKNTPDVEYDTYIGIRKPEFKTLAREWFKGTGEIIPGTATKQTESLSIRKVK